MDQNTVAAEGAQFDPARERTALVNALAEAARAALEFDSLAAAVLGAIPGTEPQQYVIAGTPAGISKMLPAVAAPSPVSEAQAEQPVVDTVRLRELAEAYRKAPLVFKTGERSHTDIALDAIVAFVAAARPTDDNLWDATLRDRDQYHEWADRLSGAIAIHFGVDIGEHSNMNCPWTEALDVIESAAPTAKEAEQASAQAAEVRDAALLKPEIDYIMTAVCSYADTREESTLTRIRRMIANTAADRDAVLEEAARCAESQNRVGREWVADSLWDNIIKRVPAAIRALKRSAGGTGEQA